MRGHARIGAASKYAVRGLSEALRRELQDQPRIQVCTVLPATMDTPFFDKMANYTPWLPKAIDRVSARRRE